MTKQTDNQHPVKKKNFLPPSSPTCAPFQLPPPSSPILVLTSNTVVLPVLELYICFFSFWFDFWIILVNIRLVWWDSCMFLSAVVIHYSKLFDIALHKCNTWIHSICWWAFDSFHYLLNTNNAAGNILSHISSIHAFLFTIIHSEIYEYSYSQLWETVWC